MQVSLKQPSLAQVKPKEVKKTKKLPAGERKKANKFKYDGESEDGVPN